MLFLLFAACILFACNKKPSDTAIVASDSSSGNKTGNLPYAMERMPDREVSDLGIVLEV
ncbi:MAG TPA: hypothetical protein VM935_16705 [Chitinophagaceae bacterium]|jgi:hypothetical protein|nr:hypothetical protein [Chitinophagaceae bacterium]